MDKEKDERKVCATCRHLGRPLTIVGPCYACYHGEGYKNWTRR